LNKVKILKSSNLDSSNAVKSSSNNEILLDLQREEDKEEEYDYFLTEKEENANNA